MFDGQAFGEQMVEVVRSFVERATAPLLDRIAVLEAREPERGERGERGAEGDPGRDGADGRHGKDGAAGRDGADGAPGPDGAKGEPGCDGAPGIHGRDGRDGAPGQDGLDGQPGHDGLPGINGRDGADGQPGREGERGLPGKDGVGLAGALIDRAGALVITLSDGTTRELGPVIGKDGRDGTDGNVGEPGRDGRDGSNGRDGIDGFGFDDLSFEHDGERGFVLRFIKGGHTKEFAFAIPTVLDRGVFKDGSEYQHGDAVSFGGSLWIAQRATSAKPDGADTGWRLAVKKGRDARSS